MSETGHCVLTEIVMEKQGCSSSIARKEGKGRCVFQFRQQPGVGKSHFEEMTIHRRGRLDRIWWGFM